MFCTWWNKQIEIELKMGTAPHFLQARTMRDTKIELKSVKADFSLSV